MSTIREEAAAAETLLAKGGALAAVRDAARLRAKKVRYEQTRRKTSESRCTRPSVLVVEDDPMVQATNARQLQRELGIDWCEANSVSAGRRALCGDMPWDVAAIDLNLEGQDGAELVNEILLAETVRVVVVLTGLDTPSARIRLGDAANDSRVQIWRKGEAGLVTSLVTLARTLAEQRKPT